MGTNDLKIDVTGPCTMNVVAYDGVYLRARQTKTAVNILAGARADIQVSCSGAGTNEIKVSGQILAYVAASSGTVKARPSVAILIIFTVFTSLFFT